MHGANVRKVEVFALQHLQCSAVVAALLVATLLHHLLLALLAVAFASCKNSLGGRGHPVLAHANVSH